MALEYIIRFRGIYGSAGLVVRLDDLEGLFQPLGFCDINIYITKILTALESFSYLKISSLKKVLSAGGFQDVLMNRGSCL